MIDAKILDRYRKILALAEGSEGHEAESARRQAERLCAQHAGLHEAYETAKRREEIESWLHERAGRRGRPGPPPPPAPDASVLDRLLHKAATRAYEWAFKNLEEAFESWDRDDEEDTEEGSYPWRRDMSKISDEEFSKLLEEEIEGEFGAVDVTEGEGKDQEEYACLALDEVTIPVWLLEEATRTQKRAHVFVTWLLAQLPEVEEEEEEEEEEDA